MSAPTAVDDQVVALALTDVVASQHAPLHLGHILRGFEQARRMVAVRAFGRPGLGAGLDELQFAHGIDRLPAGTHVTITAIVRDCRPRRNLVEYVATATPPAHETTQAWRCAEIARGRGWNLAGRPADGPGLLGEEEHAKPKDIPARPLGIER